MTLKVTIIELEKLDKEGNKPKNSEVALNQLFMLDLAKKKMRQIRNTMYPSNILNDRELDVKTIIHNLLTEYKSNLS